MNEQLNENIRQVLIKNADPYFIIVLGSYAKGTPRPDSDIDIAYFSEKKLSPYERFMLAQEIADEIKIEVDLIDIREVDTVFEAQIFSTGQLIYCANENEFVKSRMKALSMYAELNEYRLKIIEQIKERGKIYE